MGDMTPEKVTAIIRDALHEELGEEFHKNMAWVTHWRTNFERVEGSFWRGIGQMLLLAAVGFIAYLVTRFGGGQH